MALAEHLTEILDGLPLGWEVARMDVRLDDPAHEGRAAQVLAPATPGRAPGGFRLEIAGGPGSPGTTASVAGRVLARLEEEGIRARLTLVSHDEATSAAAPAASPNAAAVTLAQQWDRIAAELPGDWSDLLAEVELDSSDFVERAALHLAPANPYLVDDERTFRFRSAHRFGYGIAPQMARRCLARLDEEGMTGRVQVLRVVSDVRPVSTQGPVWRIAGRTY
jgi:hypothetical protein